MPRRSQNGWPAYATTENFTRATANLRDGKVFKFWAANDDVAVVFKEYIERYDDEVEEVSGPELDDWSYANRLVRGSAEIVSNHGSATAIDINALQYPLGTKNMSQAKLGKIRAIRRAIMDDSGRPVLRLGADYVGRVDQMHVEIDANAAKVKQAADRIREAARTMEKTDRLTLGESAAKELGKTEKDTITVEYALLWGGARGAQLRGDNVRMSKQIAGLQASVNALATAVKAVTAGSPQAVTDAFDAGVARLKDELADIDVRISLGDDETTP